MRVLRTFFWAAVLAAGFIYLTGGTGWDVSRVLKPMRTRLAQADRARASSDA